MLTFTLHHCNMHYCTIDWQLYTIMITIATITIATTISMPIKSEKVVQLIIHFLHIIQHRFFWYIVRYLQSKLKCKEVCHTLYTYYQFSNKVSYIYIQLLYIVMIGLFFRQQEIKISEVGKFVPFLKAYQAQGFLLAIGQKFKCKMCTFF